MLLLGPLRCITGIQGDPVYILQYGVIVTDWGNSIMKTWFQALNGRWCVHI